MVSTRTPRSPFCTSYFLDSCLPVCTGAWGYSVPGVVLCFCLNCSSWRYHQPVSSASPGPASWYRLWTFWEHSIPSTELLLTTWSSTGCRIRIHPWGMPLATGHPLDPVTLTTTLCFEPVFYLPIQYVSHQSGYKDAMAGWGKDFARWRHTISASLPFSIKPVISSQDANRLAGHYFPCLNPCWMFSAWSLIAPGRMCIITLCTVNGFGLHFSTHLTCLQPVFFLIILIYSYSQSQKVCSSWKNKGGPLGTQADAGGTSMACTACCQTKPNSPFGSGEWASFSSAGIYPSPFLAFSPSHPHNSSIPGVEGIGAPKYAKLKDCYFPERCSSTSSREAKHFYEAQLVFRHVPFSVSPSA